MSRERREGGWNCHTGGGFNGASLVAQMVKNPPAMQETRVRSLDWEYPLEKGMATHSSILAWRIPWTEEPGRLQSMNGVAELDTTEQLTQVGLSLGLGEKLGTCRHGEPYRFPGRTVGPKLTCAVSLQVYGNARHTPDLLSSPQAAVCVPENFTSPNRK